MPRFNVSFSDRERARLERLVKARGSNVSRLLSEAVIHLAATIELGESVHFLVPSEQREEEGKADSPEE